MKYTAKSDSIRSFTDVSAKNWYTYEALPKKKSYCMQQGATGANYRTD
jgi:hypothetical protein